MCVSYLISSYNKSEYLESVLQSVAAELAQTGGEALVLDDGSTDASWELIQEFCKRDCRITIRKQENRGIFNVTNQLINFASQKWLRLIDCDDPLIIGSTALLIETAENNKADYIFGKTIPYGPAPLSAQMAKSRQTQPSSVENLSDPLEYAIRDYNHVPTTALIRRQSIPAGTQLNETLVSCQDLALALQIFQQGSVVRIDAPLCHQLVDSSNRLSANEALTYFQTIQIIREFGIGRFDARYKYMSARKIVSRALRWMRHEKIIFNSPLLYSKLLFLYGTLLVSPPIQWERYLDNAAKSYTGVLPVTAHNGVRATLGHLCGDAE